MRQLQIEKPKISPFILAIVLAAILGTVLLSLMPNLAKPIFMKYYRTLYQVEVVRPS